MPTRERATRWWPTEYVRVTASGWTLSASLATVCNGWLFKVRDHMGYTRKTGIAPNPVAAMGRADHFALTLGAYS